MLNEGTSTISEPLATGPRRRQRVVVGLLVGFSLYVAGGYVALEYGIPQSIPFFAAGFGLVLWLSAANRRYQDSSPDLRRSIDLATAALNASLLAGILIVLNVIAFRYGGRPLDLTREQTHSLSSQTVNQLSTLKRPLTFTLVFGQGPRALAQRERVLQLLELYRAVNPAMIQVASVLNPFRAEETFKRAPDLAVLQGGGVLIEYGEGDQIQSAVVRNREMFPTPPPSRTKKRESRFESEFTGEDAITSTLISLREAKKAKVAFTTGHGEPSINDLNPRGDGLGILKSRLTAVGCEVSEIDLIKEQIPDGLALLAVVGPKSPFKPEEVAKIKAYADRRGPLLLLLGNQEKSGLEDILISYHLEIGQGVATDLRLNLNGIPRIVFSVPHASDVHPIVNTTGTRRALVPEAAPIRILGPQGDSRHQGLEPGLVPTPFLKTSPESWADVDSTVSQPKFDRDVDTPGPVLVGVAVAEVRANQDGKGPQADPKPRMVLFSSRAFAGNLVVEIENTNLDLVMNAASWLRGRPDAVGISPNTHVSLQLNADPALRARLVVVPTVTAIILIIGTGIAVYLTRRE